MIDHDAAFARHVHHVECEHQRYAHLEQLDREVEVAFEVVGIDHIDDETGIARKQVVARDLFIE